MERLLAVTGLLLLVALLLLPLVAEMAGDPAEVAARALHRAYNANDSRTLAALFADDAVVTLIPFGPVLSGRLAIQAAFEQGFQRGPHAALRGELAARGDTAAWTSVVAAAGQPGAAALHQLTLAAGGLIQSAALYLPPEVEWRYTGETGPAHWGELSPDCASCAEGSSQSPIDLVDATPQPLAQLEFHYRPSQINLVHTGSTAQVNYDPGSYLAVDGVRYDLRQFHFHTPSEHAVQGRLAAAELHLVHQARDGGRAVVGVLIERGAANAALAPVWRHMPSAISPVMTVKATVNAADLLPPVRTSYRYAGSLTTPPCTEGVSWFVMTHPIQMSEAQLRQFGRIFGANNRPLQPRYGRPLFVDAAL